MSDKLKIYKECFSESFSIPFEKIDKQNRIDNQSALTALTQQGIQLISLDAQQKIAWQDKVTNTYCASSMHTLIGS